MVDELIKYLVMGIPSAIVAIIIGSIAVWIAREHSQVVKAKFKFDLFEKRHDVFIATWKFLSDLLQKDPITTADIFNFSNNTANAKFLFNNAIVEFLEEVKMKGIQLGTAEYTLAHSSSDEVRRQMSTERQTIIIWTENEIRNVKERFKPYMDFSEWR